MDTLDFKEDKTLGLGDSYKLFMNAINKVPMKKVMFSIGKIKERDYFKNLTQDEIELLAKLINVPFHSTFSMFDLRSYFMSLSKSRG